LVSRRDREFTDFVAERGSALWRTATLLEPDASDAEQALVQALAHVRRRWSQAARDGSAEREVRERLYAATIAGLRSQSQDASVGIDAGTDTPPLTAPARQALATLPPRDRALLVLTAYEGLSETDVAHRLRLGEADVTTARPATEAEFRQALDASPELRLIALLDAAALREVPPDLAERAASTPRSRSHRSVVAIAAAVTAGAVVVALSPWSSDTDARGDVAVNEWGVPRELPSFDGLPTLAEEPVSVASTAYVADGVPIVTDADSGAARVVFDRDPSPDWYDRGGPGQSITAQRSVKVSWSQAVLSPNGKWLVMVQTLVPKSGERSSKTFVVYLPTATTTFVSELNTAPDAIGPGRIARTRIAWDPRSEGFACVCGRTLSTVGVQLVDEAPTVNVNHTPLRTDAVAGGLPGLAARDPGRGWWIVNRPSAVTDT
jgi:DNA-directed RNA polymerase specialized sigma24 family protein